MNELPTPDPGYFWMKWGNANVHARISTRNYWHRISGPAVFGGDSTFDRGYWLDNRIVREYAWGVDPRVIDFHIERGFYAREG